LTVRRTGRGRFAVPRAAGAAEKPAPAAAAGKSAAAPAGKSAAAPLYPPRLSDVRMIYDDSGHNAFTDLVRFNGEFYCCFRVGGSHLSPEGKLRVIKSDSGLKWDNVGLIGIPETAARCVVQRSENSAGAFNPVPIAVPPMFTSCSTLSTRRNACR